MTGAVIVVVIVQGIRLQATSRQAMNSTQMTQILKDDRRFFSYLRSSCSSFNPVNPDSDNRHADDADFKR
jgi:hypothetical protein